MIDCSVTFTLTQSEHELNELQNLDHVQINGDPEFWSWERMKLEKLSTQLGSGPSLRSGKQLENRARIRHMLCTRTSTPILNLPIPLTLIRKVLLCAEEWNRTVVTSGRLIAPGRSRGHRIPRTRSAQGQGRIDTVTSKHSSQCVQSFALKSACSTCRCCLRN